MDHDKALRVLNKMRDKRKELKREFEAAEKDIKDKEQIILDALAQSLLANKVRSMATENGTFYFHKEVKASCVDWDAFRKWMVENDALDAVEKRVGQGFIAQYMEDNEDRVPPGIKTFTQQVVHVRKS